jgi:2-desacetyl-2-hydroxyethyl bacteriochlorophyllide A dehydrogenase
MRAVRSTANGIEVVELPAPDGPGVRVQVRASSICGTDLAMIKGGELPVTLGHEFAGVLDDGTEVAVEPIVACGTCDQCVIGSYHMCRQAPGTFLGTGRDGGMAEEVRVPETALVPLPPSLPVSNASLVEPLAVAIHGLRIAGLAGGVPVGIVGGGSIGLCAAAAALALGCDVDVDARHDAQRQAVERLGARVGAGGEYPLVVEAAGSESGVAQAVKLCAPGGTLLLLGVYWGTLPLPYIDAFLREVRLVPALMYNRHASGRDVDAAAALLATKPTIADALITHRFPLDDAPAAFATAADRASGAIKVVLEP